jgi:hypothetical protein
MLVKFAFLLQVLLLAANEQNEESRPLPYSDTPHPQKLGEVIQPLID